MEAGRWVCASKCSARQLREYWSGAVDACCHPTCRDGNLACETHKEGPKLARKLMRQNRWGGVLFAVTSSGHIVHAVEFCGAETIPIRRHGK